MHLVTVLQVRGSCSSNLLLLNMESMFTAWSPCHGLQAWLLLLMILQALEYHLANEKTLLIPYMCQDSKEEHATIKLNREKPYHHCGSVVTNHWLGRE